MRRNLRFLIVAATAIVAVGTLTSCTPEQVEAFLDLGPRPLTVETMTPEQRTIVAAVQDRQRAWLEAVQRVNGERRAIQMNPFLTCVRRHESDRGPHPHTNGYTAQNPRSTASGAYQYLDSTWRVVSVRAGHPGYAKASHAPWYVQDAVTWWVINTPVSQSGGRGNWAGSNCPGT